MNTGLDVKVRDKMQFYTSPSAEMIPAFGFQCAVSKHLSTQ